MEYIEKFNIISKISNKIQLKINTYKIFSRQANKMVYFYLMSELSLVFCNKLNSYYIT